MKITINGDDLYVTLNKEESRASIFDATTLEEYEAPYEYGVTLIKEYEAERRGKEMDRQELIKTLKANNHVAYDEINGNDIRMAVVFRSLGFFCGYVGIPENNTFYHKSGEEIEEFFSGCNGGVTYDFYEAPTDIKADKERRWIGFDCGHSFNGSDIDLVRELFGDHQASIMTLYKYNNGRFITFDEVLEQVKEMAEVASSKVMVIENIIRDTVISTLEKLSNIEGILTTSGKETIASVIKELEA